MEIVRNRLLEHKGKKPIVYDVFYTPDRRPKPVVIFCHGYKGFKDWGAWNLVGEHFAAAGFFFLKFNFSHNGGTAENPIDFPDLQAFSENNYSIELDDLARVIDFLSGPNPFSEELQPQHISLIGHSRGGGIVLIKAAEDRRITNVVTWAGVSDYKSRFNRGTKAFAAWKQKGVKYIENGRTKQQMPHLFQFYQDFEDNEKRLTIERAVRSVRIPQLIVHGAEDPTVPVAEAHALHGWNSQSSLKIIENADHVFNTKHPWEKPVLSPQLQEAVDISISFLKKAQ